jgi:hypothetical protein
MTPHIDDILAAVLDVCNIDSRDMLGTGRNNRTCRARHIFTYVARCLTLHSYDAIAATIGRVHHTSAHNSYVRVKKDPSKFEPEISLVYALLNAKTPSMLPDEVEGVHWYRRRVRVLEGEVATLKARLAARQHEVNP